MKIRNLKNMDLDSKKSLCVRTTNGALYLVKSQFIACVDKQGNFNGSYGVIPETLSQMLNDFKEFKVISSFSGIESKVFELKKISEIYSVAAHPTKESMVEVVRPYFRRILEGIFKPSTTSLHRSSYP